MTLKILRNFFQELTLSSLINKNRIAAADDSASTLSNDAPIQTTRHTRYVPRTEKFYPLGYEPNPSLSKILVFW